MPEYCQNYTRLESVDVSIQRMVLCIRGSFVMNHNEKMRLRIIVNIFLYCYENNLTMNLGSNWSVQIAEQR